MLALLSTTGVIGADPPVAGAVSGWRWCYSLDVKAVGDGAVATDSGRLCLSFHQQLHRRLSLKNYEHLKVETWQEANV